MTQSKSPLEKKMFVLDTNVILHDYSCIYKFEEHDVVIPIQVIEELDTFKKGFEEINYNAREFCRLVDEMAHKKIFNGGIMIGENLGVLKIELSNEWHPNIEKNLSEKNTDAKILNTTYLLQEQNKERDIILVTKDVNLRLKAKAIGIIAQDFLHETVENLNILFKETKNIKMEASVVDNLFSKKSITRELKHALPNEYFIINKGENKTALAKYKDGKIFLLEDKKKVKPFGLNTKNSEQTFSADALLDSGISLVVLEGKAGTGKTILALACALQMLKTDKYEQALFTRQTISMGNHDEGFLPGDIDAKISPYMKGMYDNLDVLRALHTENHNMISDFESKNKLSIEPLSLIRGRTLSNLFFIIDEAQNLTPKEIKAITTRAGEGTKIVFLGDTKQIDHPYLDQRSNGLSYLIQKFQGQDCFAHIHLTKSERSPLAELASELL
ncbi:MAG: PhoH family protein [Candidatus Paceibacterota bacterium]